VATPSSYKGKDASVSRNRTAFTLETHLSDLLAGEAGTLNLLLILGRLLERFGQVVYRKVGDVGADAESLDAVGVKVLVAKEGLDDGRKTGCTGKVRVSSRR
jgi:hypothetical protein